MQLKGGYDWAIIHEQIKQTSSYKASKQIKHEAKPLIKPY
jgi:hypothetical protein